MSTTADNPSLAALLAVAKEAFLREGKWPTRQYVEAVLEQDHYLDLDEVLAGAPRSLVYSPGTQEGSEVVLRVAGLAAAGADREVRRFVQALGWCVEAQLGFRPSSPTATEEVKLEADQFRSEWASRGEEVSPLDLEKLRAMLITEGLYSSIGGDDGKWTLTLNRRCILPYRDVRSVEDYLRLTREEVSATTGHSLPELSPAASEPLSTQVAHPDLEELPAKVREPCATLFADGHLTPAVFEAVKAMREVLQDASGLLLDGDALAGKAFSLKDPLIVVGDLATESGRSRQQGVMRIAQGIFLAVRNPLAHQRIVVPPPEARRILAMIAFVIDAVESWQGATSPEGDPSEPQS